MPSERDHIALANKAHAVLMLLIHDSGKHSEWIATVAFYKAVHVIEAVLKVRFNRTSHDHESRLRWLKLHKLQLEHRHLRALWAASSVARYLYDREGQANYRSFDDYLPPDQVVEKLVRRRLIPIEKLALLSLSESAKKELICCDAALQ